MASLICTLSYSPHFARSCQKPICVTHFLPHSLLDSLAPCSLIPSPAGMHALLHSFTPSLISSYTHSLTNYHTTCTHQHIRKQLQHTQRRDITASGAITSPIIAWPCVTRRLITFAHQPHHSSADSTVYMCWNFPLQLCWRNPEDYLVPTQYFYM